jgi:putative salt-induced outer membrane protein YdiY
MVPPAGVRCALTATILFLFVTSQPGYAQAPAAPPSEPPPRLDVSARFTFLDTRGNASSQALGAGGEVTWRPDPWTHAAKAAFAQTKSDGELDARSLTALFRSARVLNERLSVYGQYDVLRDVFAGVDGRHVFEGGLSYLAHDAPRHRLRLDAALGYLYEQRPDDHFDSLTLSSGAAYRFAISTTSEFTYEPRVLLPLAETDAWRFDQEAALTAALNSVLSLELSHTVRYSAEPPEGFDTTDAIMAVSLVARLRRPR